MTKVVQIKPQRVESMPYVSQVDKGAYSEFGFDGQNYVLSGNQTKAVPDNVANAWVAADSNVRVVNDR